MDKLRLFKEALRTVALRLDAAMGKAPPAIDLEDRLGVALRLIRAVEGAGLMKFHAASNDTRG